MLDIGLLRTFVAVIDSGSVVAAAREVGYSPAAVSRQLARLQRRLEVRFFEPDGRSIRPTADALAFVVRVRPLLEEASRFEEFSRRFSVIREATGVGEAT
ncbi:LysR family transcriptional regulator [Microbacterium koreense]|uniref:LysR family transcriptional regulator n=1 Tax=Microbacterium koreense TaxID=323761 RepID=A0ABW2ZQE1_9MICO